MKNTLSWFSHHSAARARRTLPAGLVLMSFLMALWGLVCMATSAARADEGMWTFDNPPAKQLQRYGFTPTPEWLDHVRLSSVRFNDGGSGSFVSPHGLVLTNHHVAFGQLQKVSTPQKDYVKDGFYARTPAQELKCPDLELNVLISIENVTARVESVLKPGMSDKDALEARKAEIAKIEKESLEATGLRSDVIPLYHGGEYWLYRYKKYTDVRLVFAPERQIAFFGGDPDNFTYPRYDLDMALFRVYENEKPVETPNYLKWNPQGAADGELVFVSGNPGSTSRLDTVAQIEDMRDDYLPTALKILNRRLGVLKQYSELGPEEAREAARQMFGIENTLKAFNGQYEGLLDKALIAKKQKEESDFRALVDASAEWKREYGTAWDDVAQAEKKFLERLKQARFTSVRASSMAQNALTVVQYVTEVKKPDGKRLNGYHDSELESLRFRLFSPAPVYPRLEEALLADSLQESLEELGPDDPFVRAAQIELGAFAGGVAQRGQHRLGGAQQDVRRGVGEFAQAWAGSPAPVLVADQHAVDLQRLRETVCRGARKLGPLHQFGQAGTVDTGGKNDDRLVEDADTAHTVSHKAKHTSQNLGCPDGGSSSQTDPRREGLGRARRTVGRR